MATTNKYKAPKGVHVATIEGHVYDVPKSGVIAAISETHVATLKRHGFEEHFEEPADVSKQIDDMEDKDELVEFIEERGGEASNAFSLKKLKRLALEAAHVEV